MTRPFECVMFDCDGVLVDSETLIAELLVELANDRGGTLTLGEGYRMFHGARLGLCVERISAHLGRDVRAEVAAQYRKRSAEVFRRRLTAVDGAADLVRALAVPFCVVSNSSRDRILLNLEITGLARHFTGRVYSAAELPRGKPAPDVYLRAAAGMGVEPARCVAIEDSPAGVRSAAAAGMTVIGFGGARLRAAGARWTRRSMREVHRLVDRLARGPAVSNAS